VDVIKIERLTKTYGRRAGIAELSFSVPEGALFGFLGPNGAGKSTTIRILMGFLCATRGLATIFGADCRRDSARLKEDIGYLPGELRLYPWLTAQRALDLWSRMRRRDVRERGQELAQRFGLPLEVPASRMSRGMKQKLGLLLAMAHNPRLLILDEPTSGLDPLVQDQLFHELRRCAARGTTVLFSSHTLSEVEDLCDRVVILRDGRLVEDAALRDLAQRARRCFVLDWRDGSGARTVVPAFVTLTERSAERWQGMLDGSGSDFLAWCQGKPVADVTVGAPDLAAVFRDYYRPAEAKT